MLLFFSMIAWSGNSLCHSGFGCDGVKRYSMSMCNAVACILIDIVYLVLQQPANETLAIMGAQTGLCEFVA